MRKYLPSNKFIYTFISITIALGVVYTVSFFIKPQEIKVTSLSAETKAKIQDFMILDSDNDGMKDWEEALWKTDPKKADTDGDGTSDSEEIKLNRDPLKANTAPQNATPNDKIDEKIIADDKKAVEDFQKLSGIDKMGRLLFSEYLATKKNGQTLKTSDIQNIVNDSLDTMPAPVFKQYIIKDLHTFEYTNKIQLKEYADKINEILLNNKKAGSTNLYEITNSITENFTNDQVKEKLQTLQPSVDANHAIVIALLKVSVPSIIANTHLGLVNAFARIEDNLAQIISSANDPLKTYYLINIYPDSIQNLIDAGTRFSVL